MWPQRFLPRVPWCFLLLPTEASCSGRDESPLLVVEQTTDQALSCRGAARLPWTRPDLLASSQAGAAQEVVVHTFTLWQGQRSVHLVELRPLSSSALRWLHSWQLTASLTVSTPASGAIVIAGSCHLLFLRRPVFCVLTFPEAENSPPFPPAMFTQPASMKSSLLSSPYSPCRHHGYHLPPYHHPHGYHLPSSTQLLSVWHEAKHSASLMRSLGSFYSSHNCADEGTELRS